jgi:TM2 domain-containing membrane protein YozV
LVERNQFIIHHPTYFMLALVNWTVIPALLLFLGVVVVWLRSADREALPSRAS